MKQIFKTVLVVIGLLVLIVVLSSCTPQKRLARIVKKNPHLITQKIVIERDTIEIKKDSVITDFKIVRDQKAIDSLLGVYSMLRAWANDQALDIQVERIDRLHELKTLRTAIINEISVDTTYILTIDRDIYIGDSLIHTASRIKIHLTDSGIVHEWVNDPVRIPYEKSTAINTIDAKPVPIWTRWWFWVLIVVAGIIVVVRSRK